MAALISIKNVSFAYPAGEGERENAVLSDVSLDIEEGKITVILGKNGSGKSTLAKLCNGIIIPDSGEVTVDGMNTADESRSFDVKKTVGMVFQNPDNQMVATICEDDVAFGPENLGVPTEEIRRRVDEALAAVGMSDYAKAEPHRLSGGQKQRIAIAGVLAMNTRMVIFDEATAMLDPYGRREVLEVVKDLKKKGIGVVMITHYMEEARLADEVVVLSEGQIITKGSPLEVFSRPDILEKAGLCPPQSIELCYELEKRGVSVPLALSLDDTAKNICEALDGKRA